MGGGRIRKSKQQQQHLYTFFAHFSMFEGREGEGGRVHPNKRPLFWEPQFRRKNTRNISLFHQSFAQQWATFNVREDESREKKKGTKVERFRVRGNIIRSARFEILVAVGFSWYEKRAENLTELSQLR